VPIDQTQAPEIAAPAHAHTFGIPAGNLILSVCRNAVSQLAGRNVISLGRLVVASTIARTYGKEVFGQYSLIIVLLAIAEWLLDFGTSDVFVREICRTPERGARLLRILTALKILQIAIGTSGFLLLIFLLRYPAAVAQAGLVASCSLLFFGGVLIYHTIFKATLTIEREIAAELLSVVVMIILVRAAAQHGATLSMLFMCHVASRATFFGLCHVFGKARFHLSVKGVTWPDIKWGFHSSAAIGTIGLVVVVYETMDVLLLSRLGSLADVAYYSGAQRFITPMVVALTAIGGTLYPVAASYWPAARGLFERSCQRAMDTVFLLAGLAICVILAGPEFLMRLLGPDLTRGASVLRVLALVLFVKAITNTLGPVLYVVQAQNLALRMVIAAMIAKAALITLLAPRFGFIGVACSAVITDSATALATIYLLHRYSGFRIRWAIPLKVSAITLLCAGVPRLLLASGGIAQPIAAVALFIPLVWLSGAVRLSEVRALLHWKTS
jgi:O-antigen/teichoic acid export membrane protein